jgi:hypothetical protein
MAWKGTKFARWSSIVPSLESIPTIHLPSLQLSTNGWMSTLYSSIVG